MTFPITDLAGFPAGSVLFFPCVRGYMAFSLSRRRCDSAQELERQELVASLAHTRTLINQAYGGFNTASDGDLIESYVFEINALQARYNYLLRRVKQLEGVS